MFERLYVPNYVNRLLHKLSENGFEAYVVGGCVRDAIMGRIPEDYDITTNALPEQIKKCFENYTTILVGEKHGTVCVVSDGNNVEITTYRTDGEYKDFRHPEKVCFARNIEDDLSRRDFTMNAIAYSENCGFVDPFGGCEDIRNRIIRCVGDAKRRFEEDALRIMRALRFSSVLGFEIEENAAEVIEAYRSYLNNISKERIFTELSKMLCGENIVSVLLKFPNVISEVVPDLKKSIGFNQHNKHHVYDVYTHTAHVVGNCPDDLPLRLAALFHDVGKPSCFFTGDDGQGHFYGHAEESEAVAARVLTDLKSSNQLKRLVCELIKIHDREIVNTPKSIRRFLNSVSADAANRIFDLKKADNLSLAPEYRCRALQLEETESQMHIIMESNQCVSEKQLQINGKDLIQLGVQPGRKLGFIKGEMLKRVIDGDIENNRECLVEYAKKLINTLNNQ